jgi:hypothetical protein
MTPLSNANSNIREEEKYEALSNTIIKGTPNLVIKCCSKNCITTTSFTWAKGTSFAHLGERNFLFPLGLINNN